MAQPTPEQIAMIEQQVGKMLGPMDQALASDSIQADPQKKKQAELYRQVKEKQLRDKIGAGSIRPQTPQAPQASGAGDDPMLDLPPVDAKPAPEEPLLDLPPVNAKPAQQQTKKQGLPTPPTGGSPIKRIEGMEDLTGSVALESKNVYADSKERLDDIDKLKIKVAEEDARKSARDAAIKQIEQEEKLRLANARLAAEKQEMDRIKAMERYNQKQVQSFIERDQFMRGLNFHGIEMTPEDFRRGDAPWSRKIARGMMMGLNKDPSWLPRQMEQGVQQQMDSDPFGRQIKMLNSQIEAMGNQYDKARARRDAYSVLESERLARQIDAMAADVDPESVAFQNLNKAKMEILQQRNKSEQDLVNNLTNNQVALSGEYRAGAKDIASIQLERDKFNFEKLKELKKPKGKEYKDMDPKIAMGFSDAGSGLEMVQDMVGKFNEMGPTDTLTQFFGGDAKAYNRFKLLVIQQVGKAWEGGKMTDSDIDRYMAMFPDMSTSIGNAKTTFDSIMKAMSRDILNKMDALHSVKVDVSGIAGSKSMRNVIETAKKLQAEEVMRQNEETSNKPIARPVDPAQDPLAGRPMVGRMIGSR